MWVGAYEYPVLLDLDGGHRAHRLTVVLISYNTIAYWKRKIPLNDRQIRQIKRPKEFQLLSLTWSTSSSTIPFERRTLCSQRELSEMRRACAHS